MVSKTAQPLVEYTVDGIPYGVRTIITEKAGPVYVEPMKLLSEATKGKGFIQELADKRFRVRAKAQHCGIKNRNNRIYPPRVWEQHLTEGTPFQQRIGARGVIGHLEHPDDGKSKMPLGAVVVTEASVPDENGEVWITFETLTTPPGKIVEAYIRCRVRFGLSSRGNGSVQHRNGVDEVQEDFEPITWDCVIDESTPGAEVGADEGLREARNELSSYVTSLVERASGDDKQAAILAEQDARNAAQSVIDCPGGVCKCHITESESVTVPPSGYSRYLLAFEDGSAHYRAYQGTTGQWEVWMHPHNLKPEILASKIPTLATCQGVAENHYTMILASGAMSAQQHAANSNAIGREAMSFAPNNVMSPNIGGMAGMMGRHSGPVGPGPATSRTPRIVLSFESMQKLRPQWQDRLKVLREEWSDDVVMPYSGSVLEADASDAALSAITGAGMVATHKDGRTLVYSSFENAAQAAGYVSRVLHSEGINTKVRPVGKIRQGRAIMEANMGQRRRISEYAPDKSAPGSMAGGKTVPDDDEEVGGGVTGTTPQSIRGGPSKMDPEDLDLDLDVNEGIPYDYIGEMGYDDDDDDDDDPMSEYGMMGSDDDMDGEYEGCGDTVEMDDQPDYSYDGEPMGEMDDYYADDEPMGEAKDSDDDDDDDDDDKDMEENIMPRTANRRPTRRKRRNESRGSYYLTFTRKLQEGQPVGAVRVWFNESDIPVSYEFYNRKGILESVANGAGRIIHRALAEGKRFIFNPRREVWEDKKGRRYSPAKIMRKGISEESGDLSGRDGASTGVKMKGDQYKGSQGPEYSVPDLPDSGDRGQTGSGVAAGTFPQASEEGDGEYVEKPGKVESVLLQQIARLREQTRFLESELARAEDQIQEQAEAVSGLREAARRSELEQARAEAYAAHPELRQIENRLLRCESVSELHDEVSAITSLVESVRPTPTSAPDPAPLMERVNSRGNGLNSSTPLNGAPSGVLFESSSPFSDRLGAGVSIGSGDVASRVAAHRKRRRG